MLSHYLLLDYVTKSRACDWMNGYLVDPLRETSRVRGVLPIISRRAFSSLELASSNTSSSRPSTSCLPHLLLHLSTSER